MRTVTCLVAVLALSGCTGGGSPSGQSSSAWSWVAVEDTPLAGPYIAPQAFSLANGQFAVVDFEDSGEATPPPYVAVLSTGAAGDRWDVARWPSETTSGSIRAAGDGGIVALVGGATPCASDWPPTPPGGRVLQAADMAWKELPALPWGGSCGKRVVLDGGMLYAWESGMVAGPGAVLDLAEVDAGSGAWRDVASLPDPTPLEGPSVEGEASPSELAVLERAIYVANVGTTGLARFSIDSGTWEEVEVRSGAALNRERATRLVASASQIALTTGDIGIVLFSPESDRWRTVELPAGFVERVDPVLAFIGEDLVLWGGRSAEQELDSTTSFGDGIVLLEGAEQWSELPSSPLSPRSLAAYASNSSELFIYGGLRGATDAAMLIREP